MCISGSVQQWQRAFCISGSVQQWRCVAEAEVVCVFVGAPLGVRFTAEQAIGRRGVDIGHAKVNRKHCLQSRAWKAAQADSGARERGAEDGPEEPTPTRPPARPTTCRTTTCRTTSTKSLEKSAA